MSAVGHGPRKHPRGPILQEVGNFSISLGKSDAVVEVAVEQHVESRALAMITRCLPCVSIWLNPETNETAYMADIRFASSVPPPSSQRPRRSLHPTQEQAFEELVVRVKQLPELFKEYEIVVKDRTYTDVEQAARAIETRRPMSEDLAKA